VVVAVTSLGLLPVTEVSVVVVAAVATITGVLVAGLHSRQVAMELRTLVLHPVALAGQTPAVAAAAAVAQAVQPVAWEGPAS
jgi:hypothetical protein